MASKLYPNVAFKLYGDEKSSTKEIKTNDFDNFEFIHTNESIKSDDEPVHALRKLKKSSMRLGINEVSEKKLTSVAKSICSGGLGLYPGFIHIDSGPVRRWGI